MMKSFWMHFIKQGKQEIISNPTSKTKGKFSIEDNLD